MSQGLWGPVLEAGDRVGVTEVSPRTRRSTVRPVPFGDQRRHRQEG